MQAGLITLRLRILRLFLHLWDKNLLVHEYQLSHDVYEGDLSSDSLLKGFLVEMALGHLINLLLRLRLPAHHLEKMRLELS